MPLVKARIHAICERAQAGLLRHCENGCTQDGRLSGHLDRLELAAGSLGVPAGNSLRSAVRLCALQQLHIEGLGFAEIDEVGQGFGSSGRRQHG